MTTRHQSGWTLKILEAPEEMAAVEHLQKLVWQSDDLDVIPLHVLVTWAENGGLVIGAYEAEPGNDPGDPFTRVPQTTPLIGFAAGFAGLSFTPDGARPKHCSHELAVHPEWRGRRLGFALKRAQWQMVRRQGLDLITWTYDPLLSQNAFLNIARLGAVCRIYRRNIYGDMRDGLNAGVASDRFQVDWWVNTQRVQHRLSKQARPPVDLDHILAAGAAVINPTQAAGPGDRLASFRQPGETRMSGTSGSPEAIVLVEIPADFHAIRTTDSALARAWREHSRGIFEEMFHQGYWVTDFVHQPEPEPRSFYVLSHGESTLLSV